MINLDLRKLAGLVLAGLGGAVGTHPGAVPLAVSVLLFIAAAAVLR